MQRLVRGQETQLLIQKEISNGTSYEVILKNKFSCKETTVNVEGFICRDKAFLLINTDVPCGDYLLIFDQYKIGVKVDEQ